MLGVGDGADMRWIDESTRGLGVLGTCSGYRPVEARAIGACIESRTDGVYAGDSLLIVRPFVWTGVPVNEDALDPKP